MRDLNRHLNEQDLAHMRELRAERILEDDRWIRDEIGDFALSHVEWEWIALLCRRLYAREDVTQMLDGLRVDLAKHLWEKANG